MNLRPYLSVAALVLCAPLAHAADNQLSKAEKAQGWELLFDGKTLNGWNVYRQKTPPNQGWEVKEGTLRTVPKVKGTNIVTERKFKDFEFSWEWRIQPAGNNGIKYFVTEDRPSAPGHEYQLIDDGAHSDGRMTKRQTGSFYDVLPPAADKPLKKPGEWNASRILVRGEHVEHWLNGKKILAYELGSPEVKAGLVASKFAKHADFGTKIVGPIMITHHTDECWFRNLKIRELK
ncbi:MAG: DUF1080 domain-containing protein [Opitutaceae bacterium]|nr:DUF1080 domain-containing protein [Opitutaceae bacterium]